MNLESSSQVCFALNPKRITIYFAWPVLFFAIAHVVGQLIRYHTGLGNNIFIRAFNLDWESSIPSLYVIMEWLFCLALLSIITFVKRKQKSPYAYWMGLVILFSFLTLDEFMSIHERLSGIIHHALNTSGVLLFAWIIPYSILMVILGIVYLRFLFNLPTRIRNLFLFAFVVFVFGALGVEFFEGGHADSHGKDYVYYLFFVTLEESLEMTGLVIFVYALSSYITEKLGTLMFRTYLSNNDLGVLNKTSCEDENGTADRERYNR
jgi:hypothetical protein